MCGPFKANLCVIIGLFVLLSGCGTAVTPAPTNAPTQPTTAPTSGPSSTPRPPTVTPVPPTPTAIASTPTPSGEASIAIARAALTAESAGDVDKALAQYTDGASWVIIEGTASKRHENFATFFNSKDAIRANLQSIAAEHLKIEVVKADVDPNLPTVTRNPEPPHDDVTIYVRQTSDSLQKDGITFVQVIEYFTVQSGKIRERVSIVTHYVEGAGTPTPLAQNVFPTGVYEAKFAFLNDPVQRYRLVFTPDGRFYAWLNFTGRYEIKGNQVSLTSNDPDCNKLNGDSGTYTWSFDGTALVFSEVKAECKGWRAFMVGRPWVKQD